MGATTQIIPPPASGGGGGSVGAKPLKTGATISFRTGDDKDLNEGRPTDWLTLSVASPFGNTNRFTDEFGGATYASGVVIDWSTFDGSTVLGWDQTISATGKTWNKAIDEALLISLGTFTTGWQLPNANELASIAGWGVGARLLAYAPFNDSTNARMWSSTTYSGATTQALLMGNQNGVGVVSANKTAGFYFKACREFTVTGTVLT